MDKNIIKETSRGRARSERITRFKKVNDEETKRTLFPSNYRATDS